MRQEDGYRFVFLSFFLSFFFLRCVVGGDTTKQQQGAEKIKTETEKAESPDVDV